MTRTAARSILCLLILVCATTLAAAPKDARVRAVVAKGSADLAHWGVYAVDVESGAVVADVGGGKLMVPASTRKLVTAALVTEYLEADKRFETVAHVPAIPRDGIALGDLVVRGCGDPTWRPALLGGRPGASKLRELARVIRRSGVERVTGDLVIDTSRFEDASPVPPGWEWEDLQTIDGAIPSVFGIDANLAGVRISPASTGQPPVVSHSGRPAFEIVNRAVTGSRGSAPTFQLSRSLDGGALTLTGSLPADSAAGARSVPVGDPVSFAAAELLAALGEEGVAVEGEVRLSADSIAVGHVVAIIQSAPLGMPLRASSGETIAPPILSEMNKSSDNHLAESLYLLAGAEAFGRGSYRSASEAEKRYWKSLGVSASNVVGIDGSGLARRNLITPSAMVALLVDKSDNTAFMDSLPVAGVDGTLRYRLHDEGLSKRVFAKTGTLTGVSALAGYVTTNSGRQVAFAIMANNYTASASSIRGVIDEAVGVLAE